MSKDKPRNDHKSGRGPQPYPGFHDAVARASRTLAYLESIEGRVRSHQRARQPTFQRALDLEVEQALQRLADSINQTRREIADKLPAE